MKKNYSTFSFANCCKVFMAAVMMLATVNLQAQACVGGSPTSPGANVTITVCTGSDVAVGTESVLVFNAGGTSVNLYTLGDVPIINTGAGVASSIGKVIKAEVINGGTVSGGITTGGTIVCWGYIKLEDKTAPVVVPPAAITVQCNAAAAVSLPPSTTGTPAITDCSTTTSTYSDAMVSMGCLQSLARVIDRTWTVKDAYGNVTVSAPQRITVSRSLDATVPAADAAPIAAAGCGLAVANTLGMFEGGNSSILCSVVGSAGAQAAIDAVRGPYVILNATRFYLAENTVCGLSATLVGTPRILALCPGSFKTIRTWRVIDLCSSLFPATNLTMSCDIQQVITFTDDVAPTASYSTTNFNLVADGTSACATVNSMIPGMIPATVKLQGVPTGVLSMGATTIIKPRSAAGMCGVVDIDLTVTPADACGELATLPVSVSDTRLAVTALTGAALGTYRITGRIMNVSTTVPSTFGITFTDKCGNFVKRTVSFVYEDNISPVAVCDGVTATLNNLKIATVNGENFNQRSTDNCGVAAILIAKNAPVGGQDRPGTFCDEQSYGCIDTNTTAKVWIRYIDFRGNYTDCCVPLSIIDKSPISCFVGIIPSISCTDARLNTFGNLFVAPVVFYDGCDRIDTIITNTSVAVNCGVGSFTRSWVFGAKNVLGEQRTTACTQTLNVTAVRGFRVTRLPNLPVDCAGAIPTLKKDQDDIIASMSLNHSRTSPRISSTVLGDDTGTAASTAFSTCSAPVVDTTESIYRNAEFCRVIVRTFVIKDVCGFSTVNSSITQGNVYDNVGSLVAESVVDAAGNHFIKFTRTITVRDQTPPTTTKVAYREICAAPTACNFSFSQLLAGADLCSGLPSGSNLFFSWTIVSPTGAETRGNGPTVSASNLAFGTYAVFFNVSDLCGNISARDSFSLRGRDCKAPQILVHNKVVALGGIPGTASTGMAELLYIDIRNNIFDNCDGDITDETSKIVMELVLAGEAASPLAPRPASTTRSVMFDCSHVGTQRVRVWARDNAGNWNFAISTITVQDNDGICSPRAMFVGAAATENNSPVKDVVIAANVNGVTMGSATSTAAGAFSVTNLPANASYQVRAAKTIDTDKKNGVTTLDIALISKHNLGIEALATPYRVIAADVNKDGEVDGTDMLHIRRFILSITPSLPAGSAWRFVDKSYTFRNPANPFGEDFPEVVNLSNVPAGTTAANFTAVKLGDVNNSFDATQVRGSKALTFNANDMDVVAGNEYTVAINAANFNASAFQGTFAFEGATVKAVKAGNLNNTSDANFGMFSKAVTASWNGTSEASAEVVNITFVATKSGKLSEMLTVNSSVTMAEGYDAAGNAMNVTLKFNTGKVAGGEFALYQNTPNPVATSTSIGFNLPKDGQAKLTIYTAEGKVLSVINNTYKAGANQVTVNKADLNASGMLYYRLDTQDNSSTRKMIIIE